ncbi:MAG: SURF1 family protein [Sphingomonadaceae bacterium]
MVLIIVPMLVGFGIWQLQRMEWKQTLLADLAVASSQPITDMGTSAPRAGMQFRHVRLTVSCPPQTPDASIGHGPQGQSGWSHLLTCTSGNQPIRINIGWSPQLLDNRHAGGRFVVTGILVESEHSAAPYVLVADTAEPPLLPSAPPSTDNIPNNHLSYALQWFCFAAILLLVWVAYVVRWRQGPNPRD